MKFFPHYVRTRTPDEGFDGENHTDSKRKSQHFGHIIAIPNVVVARTQLLAGVPHCCPPTMASTGNRNVPFESQHGPPKWAFWKVRLHW